MTSRPSAPRRTWLIFVVAALVQFAAWCVVDAQRWDVRLLFGAAALAILAHAWLLDTRNSGQVVKALALGLASAGVAALMIHFLGNPLPDCLTWIAAKVTSVRLSP